MNPNANECLDEAYRRGYDYCTKVGCAPGVFAAAMEALGHGDDQAAKEAWKATVGLIGGTGNMAVGTCGAMSGAAMAVSYSYGLDKEAVLKDRLKMMAVGRVVTEVGKLMQQKYGHITCQEVQFSLWGKSYRFTNPEAVKEFMTASMANPRCSEVTGDLARWTVEKILEHNPAFSKR